MDRNRYRTRVVNQRIPHDTGWRMVVCNILFNIPFNTICHTTDAGTNPCAVLRMDRINSISVYIRVGCRNCSGIFNDNIGIYGIYFWTHCNFNAQYMFGILSDILY